jgi:hypothetical protein
VFRREKICKALQWLKENNPLYEDIIISEKNLQDFPVDGIPEEIALVTCYSDDTSLHCPRARLGQGWLIFADPGPDPRGSGQVRADPRASYI